MAENQDIQKITAEQGKLEALKADQQAPDQLRKDLAKYRAVYFDELNSGKNQLAAAIGEGSTFKSKEAKAYLEINVASRLSTAVEGLATEGQRIKTAQEEKTEYPTLKSLKDTLKSELSHEQKAFSEYRDLEAIRTQHDELNKQDDAIDAKNSAAGLEGSLAQKKALVKALDTMSKTLSGKSISIATDLFTSLKERVTKTKERIQGDVDDGGILVTAKGAYKEVNTTITLTESALTRAKKPLTEAEYKSFMAELKVSQEEVNDIYSRHNLDILKTTDVMFLKPLNNTFYPTFGEPVAKHVSTVLAALEKAKPPGSKEALDPDLQAQLDYDNAKAKIDGFNKEMEGLEKEIADNKKDPAKYNDRKVLEALQKKYDALRKSYDDFMVSTPFNQNTDKRSESIVKMASRFSTEVANPASARLDKLKDQVFYQEANVDKFEKDELNKKVAEMLPKMQEQWKANVEDQKKYLEQTPNFDEESKEFKEHVAGEDKLFTFVVNCEAQLGFLASKSGQLDKDNYQKVKDFQKLCAPPIDAITNNRSIRAMKKAATDTPDQTFTVKVKTGTRTYYEGSEDGKHKPTKVTEDVYEDRTSTYKFTECVEFINPNDPKFAEINKGKGFRFLKEDLPEDVKTKFELQAGLIITKQKENVQGDMAKKKMEILKTGNLLEMGKQQLGEKGKAYFAALDFLGKGDTANAIKSFEEYIALSATFSEEEKELHKMYLSDAKAQIEAMKVSPGYYEALNMMKQGAELEKEGKFAEAAKLLDDAIAKLRSFVRSTNAGSEEDQKKCSEQLSNATEILKRINTAKLNMLVDLKKDLEYVEVRRIITNGSPSKADDKDLKEPFRSLMLPYLPYDQLTPAEQTLVAQGRGGLQGEEIQKVNAKIRDLKKRIEKGEPIDFEKEMGDFKLEMQEWNDKHVWSNSKKFSPGGGPERPDWPSERLFYHFEQINSSNGQQRKNGFLEVAKFMKDEHDDLSDKKLGMRYTQKYLEKAMDADYEVFTKKDGGKLREKIAKEMLSNTEISLDVQKQAIDYYNRWAKEQNLKLPPNQQYPLDKPDQGTVQLFQRQIFEQRLDYQYKREVRKKMTDAGEATSDSALELYNWSLPYNDGSARWYKPWSWSDYNQDDWVDFKDKAKQLAAETIVTLPIGMGAGAIGKAIGTAGIRMLAAEGLSEAAIMTIERGGILALRSEAALWNGISTGMKARIMLAYGVGVAAEGGAMITLNSLWEGFSTGRTPEFFHHLEAGEWGKVATSLLESSAKAGAFRVIGASSQKLFGKTMQEGTAGEKILATVGSESFSGFVGTGLEALTLYAKGQGNEVTFDFWMKSLAQNAIQSYGTHLAHGTAEKPAFKDKTEAKFKQAETEIGVTRLKNAGVHDAGDISHISIAPDGSMKSKYGLDIDPTKIKLSALPEPLRAPFEAKVKEAQTIKDTNSFAKGELPAQMIIAAKDGKLTLANGSEIPYEPSTLEPKYQKQVDNIRAAELKKQRPVIEKAASLVQEKEGLDPNKPADKERLDAINKELATIAKERDISVEKLNEVAVKENLLQQAVIALEKQQGQLLHDSKVVTLPDGRRINLFENFYSKTSAYSGDLLAHLDHASLAAEGGSRLIKIGGDELVLYHAGPDGSVQKLFIDISNMGPANDVAVNINGSKVNLVDIYLYKISERITKLSHDSVGKSLDQAKFASEVNSVVRELFYIDQDAAGHPLPEAKAKKNFDKLKKEWGLAGEYKDYLASVQAMRYMAEYRADSRGLDSSFKGKEGTFSEHVGKEVEAISGMSFAEVQKLFAENQQAIIDLIKARQPEASKYAFLSPEKLIEHIKQLDPSKSKASDIMPLYNLLARLDFASSSSPALQKLGQKLSTTRTELIGQPPHSRIEAPRIMDAKVVNINLSKEFTAALHKLSETDPTMAHAILTAARNMAEGPLDKQKYAKGGGFAEFKITDHVELKDGKIVIKPEATEFQRQVNDALLDKKVGTIIETEKRLTELKTTYEKLLADYREGRIDLETLNKKLPELDKQIAELNRLTTTDPDTGAYSQAYLDLRPSDMFIFPDGEIPADSRLWHSISTEINLAGAINSKYGYSGLDLMMSSYHEIIQKGLKEAPYNLEHFRVIRSGGKFEIIFLDSREISKLSSNGTSPEKILEKIIKEKAQPEIDKIMQSNPEAFKAIQSDAEVRNSASKFVKGRAEAKPGELTFQTETNPPIEAHEIAAVFSKKPGASAREVIGGVMADRNAMKPVLYESQQIPLAYQNADAPTLKEAPPGTPAHEVYKFQRMDHPVEMTEVPRATEVVAVGDLHGNGDIFVENMKSAKIVGPKADFTKPETISWIGGNRRVVFHGDILADRGTDSLQIMASLRKLQTEARKAGGEVVLISGNHEDMALSFLMGKMVAGGQDPMMHNGFNMSLYGNQGAGLLEFIQKYSGDPRFAAAKSLEDVATIAGFQVDNIIGKKLVTDPKFPAYADQLGQKCLENMRKDAEGRKLLEQMASLKVGEYIDDALFLHTDPSPKIIELINKYGGTVGEAMDKINAIYQQGLRSKLLGEGTMPTEFKEIADAFTDTSNRSGEKGYKGVPVASLKAKGVNRIIHGHSDYNGKRVSIDGVEITSVDVNAGKGGEDMNKRSIALVEKTGIMTTGDGVELIPGAKTDALDSNLKSYEYVNEVDKLKRDLYDSEIDHLNQLLEEGQVSYMNLRRLAKKMPLEGQIVSELLIYASEDAEVREILTKSKSLTPEQQLKFIDVVEEVPDNTKLLGPMLNSGKFDLKLEAVLKFFLSDRKGISHINVEVRTGRFVPNRAYVEKMISTRELWNLLHDPTAKLIDKVPPELKVELSSQFEKNKQIYDDSNKFLKFAEKPDFSNQLKAAVAEVNSGEANSELAGVLSRFKDRDSKGYEVLKANTDVKPEFAQAIIDGNFVEHQNSSGNAIRAYIGKSVGGGGYGMVHLTAFTEGGSSQLKYGVIKRPQPHRSKEEFAPEVEGAQKISKWDSPYINKAMSISPEAIIYETGSNPQRFDTAFRKATEKKALELLSQVVSGLQAYRDNKAFHADIKPDNILVMDMGKGPQVVIIDNTPHPATAEGVNKSVPGTIGYMPMPEAWDKIRSNPELSGAIDAHALGTILSQLALEPNISTKHKKTLDELSRDCYDTEKAGQPGFLKNVNKKIAEMIAEIPAANQGAPAQLSP